MLTGLVYAAVIVLWALVLVPQWLRRHERNSEQRTTLTFHRAMRTLERRRITRGASRAPHSPVVTVSGAQSRVHDRVALTDDGMPVIDSYLDSGIDPFVGTETEEAVKLSRREQAREDARLLAAARRRQIQQILGGVTVVFLILALLGFMSVFMAVLPMLALGIYWYLARKQDERSQTRRSRSSQRASRRAESTRRTRSERSRTRTASTPAKVPASASSDAGDSGRKRSVPRSSRARRREAAAANRYSDAPAITVTAADDGGEDFRVLTGREAESARARKEPGAWDPAEPTVSKYARRGSSDGSDWTGERLLEQAEALRTGEDVDAELGLDELVAGASNDDQPKPRFRVVNE